MVFSLTLMYPLRHNGIALAGSISAAVNVGVLAFVLRNKIGPYLDRAFYASVFKIVASSAAMLAAIGLVEYGMPWNTSSGFRERLIYLVFAVGTGAVAYFVCAYLLKSPEMSAFLKMVQKRLTGSGDPTR